MSSRVSVIALSLLTLIVALASPVFAGDLGQSEKELIAKYGQPTQTLPVEKTAFWEKGVMFNAKKFSKDWLVLAYFKGDKTCSIVYGYATPKTPIGQSEILLLLSENAAGKRWNKQVITQYYRLSWFRQDNGAFAFYDGQDKRPCLNVMNRELWDLISSKLKHKEALVVPAPR